MLNESKVFSSYSVDDIRQAKDFYGRILGLNVQDDPMGILQIHFANGVILMIYPKPDHIAATFTVFNFHVENIENTVNELITKGIKFEQYNSEYIKTDEKGISRGDQGPNIAWFKDPAGNILSVLESK
ncbi:VOC family protein [Pedobacter sp. AW1-32]|uniref:VOC family protein n=1 Tax=Pedobacter sp. AW1-32 TaxID=3383026 RepID=UPI003FF12DF2